MEQVQITEPEGDILQVILTLWRVCKKARWWMLLAALVAVSGSVIGLSFVPNRYKSVARILVVEQQIPQNMVAPLSNVPVEQVLEGMKQEVLSRPRLLEIVNDVGLFPARSLPEASVEQLQKFISIVPIDPTREGSFSAFDISFTGSTPELAQAVTRRLSSLFIERRSERETQRADTTSTFLEEQLDQKRKTSADLEQRMRNFRSQYSGELPDEAFSGQTQAAEAQVQSQNTLASLNRARSQRASMESTLRLNLNARLTHLKDERTTLLLHLTPKHPDVVKNEELISQIQGLLASIQAEIPPTDKQLIAFSATDPAIVQMVGQLEANQLEIDNLSKDQRRIESVISEYQRRFALMPAREQQLAGMQRELATVNQEIDSLVKMKTQSGMAADMERRQEGQQFRQLEAATLPDAPSSPQRLKISLGALAGGIVVGFLIAFLLEMLHPTFHTEEELKRRVGAPLVLSVPLLLTPVETRRRKWIRGVEWVAGSLTTTAIAIVEFYVFKHP